MIKLTRNKKLYLKLEKNDTFSDRLVILFFHFGFFLKVYKSQVSKQELQELFDFVIGQIDISIREIGYGDASINRKMKDFLNFFYLIIEKVELWNTKDDSFQKEIIKNYLNIDKNLDFFTEYFTNYELFLKKNALKKFTKDIIELKF